MRLKVSSFEIVPTEDIAGRFEDTNEPFYRRCYDVLVEGQSGRYCYTLGFWEEDEAIAFGKRVVLYGSINPDKWHCISNPVSLPDYVTHFWREEFN